MADAKDNVIKAGMDDILVKPSELPLVKAKIIEWTANAALSEVSVGTSHKQTIDLNLFDMTNLSDDPAEQYELLMDYCEQTLKDISVAGKACRQKSAQALKSIAHQIKGASRLVGSAKIAQLSERLEDISEGQDWDLCHECVSEIDSELAKIQNFLKKSWSSNK
jgi:HPt (histidine-containing phosphotransfer) domain-containing protein